MRRLIIALFMTLLTACQVNPVTGERHLQFYDTQWEQEVGSQYYAPMRQTQGGDYRLDPDLTAYVQQVGERLARNARRKDELNFEFRVLNDSTPNAWALPGGKIAINRGLLTELENEAELAAVLGHEIVHADAAHGARAQSRGALTQLGAIAGMILIDSKADSSVGKQAAAIIPMLGAQLITTKYGRDAERESDFHGMHYMSAAGYDPQGAVGLQETFVRLSEGRRDDWLSGLFSTHPPSRERVERNRQTAAGLPRGGETGAQRYQQATRYLREVKPAYEAYDAALKAARDENHPAARENLDRAMEIEPREALFHALDGDLLSHEKRHSSAWRSFDRAVQLDDGFFYHLLRRGRSALELDRRSQAREDLERSIGLLPTAQGHYLLGNLDRDDGNPGAARKHYQAAAQSDSEAGRNAERELVRMDIGAEPGTFIQAQLVADDTGRIGCRLKNRTRTGLTSIRVLAVVSGNGESRRLHGNLDGTLEGGQERVAVMGRGAISGTDSCSVESARVID